MQLTENTTKALAYIGCRNCHSTDEAFAYIDRAFTEPQINYYPAESDEIYLDNSDYTQTLCNRHDYNTTEDMLNDFIVKACGYIADTASDLWDNEHTCKGYSPECGDYYYTLGTDDSMADIVLHYYGEL